MPFNNIQEQGRPITIKDEGLTLVTNVESIDFTGAGVSGTNVGNAVTEEISGGGGGSGSPGGSTTQVQFNDAGSFNGDAGFTYNKTTDVATLTGGLIIGNGGSLKTTTTTGHTLLIQGYDVDGAAYVTFATITNGNTPTMDLSTSVTIGGGTIATTALKLSNFAATTSAELKTVISDETGSGALVFGTSPTFTTSITGSYLTASEILITDASKNIVSAAVATYPSLTELTYLKGVTSAIQTQLNAKGVGTVTSVSSADGALSVANGTTTPTLTINSAPILTTARTIGGVSFDGSANITVASATGGFAVSGGALTVGAGTVSAPAVSFTADADNGMYYLGTNNYAFAVGGSKVLDLATTGLTITGNVSATNLSGTNTGDQTITLSGDVSGSGTGAITTAIGNNKVTNAMLATMATASIKGRTTAGTGNVEDLTAAQATAILNAFVGDAGSGGTKGLVPAPTTGDATKFLKGDGTWASISGGGDALTTNPLSQFAATTSSQLAGVISDETGSGALVFATSPTLVTPILGTPTSGTLTNCTGLPISGLVASTSTAIGVGSIELGHASDTTLARVSAGVVSIEGVNIVTTSSTDTLTNKTLTAPKIADLGYLADANGNELIIFDTVASAVNEVTFANAATGNDPNFTATGGDTNVGIKFTTKGTGKIGLVGSVNHGDYNVYFTETDNGNSSTADTIDWTKSNHQKSTLTGNCTFTFTAPNGPCMLSLKLVQDGTGSRTVTWPAAVHWTDGTAPTLTATASKVDIITFYYDGTTYFGAYAKNYTA